MLISGAGNFINHALIAENFVVNNRIKSLLTGTH